eukprot:1158641-Pelagomonas_calceolata.AAC.2
MKYTEIADVQHLIGVVEDYLKDYNSISKRPMNLAMFLFAVEHISRICSLPAIAEAFCNLQLSVMLRCEYVSCCTAFLRDQHFCFTAAVPDELKLHPLVEISKSYGRAEWREDLKKVLQRAGAETKPTVFLFSDAQIKEESFVEDINNLLNAGEVPNMFPSDERMAILEAVRPEASKQGLETPVELWGFFVQQVCIHGIGMQGSVPGHNHYQLAEPTCTWCGALLQLALPSGSASAKTPLLSIAAQLTDCAVEPEAAVTLNTGCLLFVAVIDIPLCKKIYACEVGCKSSPGPSPAVNLAMQGTAIVQQLGQTEQMAQGKEEDATRIKLVTLCQEMHRFIVKVSQDFLQDQGRYNYVTPTSYLELITCFKSLLEAKRTQDHRWAATLLQSAHVTAPRNIAYSNQHIA